MIDALDRIGKATASTPYEGHLWVVGGAVRDELLKMPLPNDLDIVLEDDATVLADFLWKRGCSDIEPVVYPRFGTALIRVGGTSVELATARTETYADSSRKPNVSPASLETDARRRDFSVNTLLKNVHSGELRDPLGNGIEDLQAKVLRTPLNPEATFFDDPLRMLRAVRFVHQLGFSPAPGLYEAARIERARLSIISAERIRDELTKMLVRPTASAALRDLLDTGLLEQFAPELASMVGVEQGGYHHLDVWNHSLLVLDHVHSLAADFEPERRLGLAWAALLHDVGKPATRFVDDDGHIRFFGHETLGSKMSTELLSRLKYSGATVEQVANLVRNHMRLGSMPVFSASAARRVVRDLGDQLDDLLLLVEADARSLKPGIRRLDLEPIRNRISELRSTTPRALLESPLTGEEIMAITGLPPGPKVGDIKNLLTEKVLEGELEPGDVDAASAFLRSLNRHE